MRKKFRKVWEKTHEKWHKQRNVIIRGLLWCLSFFSMTSFSSRFRKSWNVVQQQMSLHLTSTTFLDFKEHIWRFNSIWAFPKTGRYFFSIRKDSWFCIISPSSSISASPLCYCFPSSQANLTETWVSQTSSSNVQTILTPNLSPLPSHCFSRWFIRAPWRPCQVVIFTK